VLNTFYSPFTCKNQAGLPKPGAKILATGQALITFKNQQGERIEPLAAFQSSEGALCTFRFDWGAEKWRQTQKSTIRKMAF